MVEAPDSFDPYYKWLGILPREQPPHHYRLLSIQLFESDPDVITNAADRQMGHVRTFQTGPHSVQSQRLLNELSAARLCLLHVERKRAYDAQLARKLQPPAPIPPVQVAPPVESAAVNTTTVADAPATPASARSQARKAEDDDRTQRPFAAERTVEPIQRSAAQPPPATVRPRSRANWDKWQRSLRELLQRSQDWISDFHAGGPMRRIASAARQHELMYRLDHWFFEDEVELAVVREEQLLLGAVLGSPCDHEILPPRAWQHSGTWPERRRHPSSSDLQEGPLRRAVKTQLLLVPALLLLLAILHAFAGLPPERRFTPTFDAVSGIDTEIGVAPDIDTFAMSRSDAITNQGAVIVDNPYGRLSDSFNRLAQERAAGAGGGDEPKPSSDSAAVMSGGIGGLGHIDSISMRSAIPGLGRGSPIKGAGRRRSNAASGGIAGAGDVNGAADILLSSVLRENETGDLLVVWLIDGSLALVEDRQKLADRIEPFFREIELRPKGVHRLQNAVVVYGNVSVEMVRATASGAQITAAIRTRSIDNSGLENVMAAVDQVVDNYRSKWKGGMLINVWTDESGDDVTQLEKVISKCRYHDVAVNVVGPTAVLGSENGRHYYVDKGTGLAFLLPIKRGPDSALPERLFLPYWFESPLAPWTQDGVVSARGVPWYGGPHREGILSGVGPYALTRLALETGGQFIAFDRPENKGPFSLELMKRYLPDYTSPEDYVRSVNSSELRKSVSQAVQSTYSVANLQPPSSEFILARDTYYPFSIFRKFYTPERFRELLKEELSKQLMHANATADVVETALAKFPAAGMEWEHQAERSPRWRAWYDLTRGRLLAMSVRTLEYRMACEKISQPGFLAPETNRIELRPAAEYLSGAVSEARANEAVRLLTRCQTENEGTPWALLAGWELAKPLGVSIKQIVQPPPKPAPPPPPRPPAPTITFPKL